MEDFTPDDLLSNAACGSQNLELLDNEVVRGAVLRSICQWIRLRRGYNPSHDELMRELKAHQDYSK